jgi:4-amino-4-deoxy-L-arabinose transferase-like glycosyltransferase
MSEHIHNEGPSLRLVALLIILATVITRLPTLWVHVFDVDETIWAVAAKMMAEGHLPYLEFADNKPLGVMAFMAMVFKTFGRMSLIDIHAVTMIVVAMTAGAIFRLTESLSNRRAALASALLYVLFITNYIPKVISTNIETLINLPLVLCLLALFKSYDRKTSLNLYLAGACVGLACCFKYQAGMMAIFVPSILLWRSPYDRGGKRHVGSIIRGWAWFSVGVAGPFLLMLLYVMHIGVFDEFAYSTLSGSMTYISAGRKGLDIPWRLLTRVGTFLLASSPLWILSTIRTWGLIREGEGRWKEGVVVLWVLITSIPVFVGWRFYGHYFLLWVPGLAILGGMQLAESWSRWSTSRTGRLARAGVIGAIALITIGFALPRYDLNRINKLVGEDNPYDYIPIAEAIKSRTTPTDRIFVWGFAPCIYYFSQRFPAYRFFWFDHLTGRSSLPGKIDRSTLNKLAKPDAWDIWLDDMKQNQAIYIVDTAPAKLHDAHHYPIQDYKILADYIEKYYYPQMSVEEATLYRRKGT